MNLGILRETETVLYLEKLGWTVLRTNWRRKQGELDIVAYDATEDTLVIVEVKARQTQGPASDLELMGKVKRRRLERTAREFLAGVAEDSSEGWSEESGIRFDLVVWRGEELRHYPEVF